MVNPRIKSLIRQLPGHQLDALLITKSVNITYLTKFESHDSWLLVTPKKTFYITDFRYILEAKKGLKAIEIVRYEKSMFEAVWALVTKYKIKNLGFDDRHLTLAQYKVFMKGQPKGVKLVVADNLVEDLREIKEDEEVDLVREALGVHAQALKYLKNVIKPGISEKQVLFKLEMFVKSRGLGFSFSPIIASGPNSCFPHAVVTDRKIQNNEAVLVDFGIDVKGYKSDLTRMFFLGRIPQLIWEVNAKVEQAQRLAIAQIKPGIKLADVDGIARNSLAKHKLDKYFGHGLGHGVGLEIHENPRLSKLSEATFKPGMVVTVEPAVYLPNKFGIRIEDMILVTDQNCEVLSGKIDH